MIKIDLEHRKKKIRRERLSGFAVACYDLFKALPSKKESLQLIAEKAASELGGYLNPCVLAEPDDVSISFIELLDQILFEMGVKHRSADNNIEEYIIDDLYQRIEVYLDALKDIEIYKKNYTGRVMIVDDVMIIKQCRIREFIPHMISEFFEQPHLRMQLVRALASFDDEGLLNFFYEIAKNEYSAELRILSLIGLKNNHNGFNNWEMLHGDDRFFNELVSYIQTLIGKDRAILPVSRDNVYILIFQIFDIDTSMPVAVDYSGCMQILNVLYTVPDFNIEASAFKQYVFDALSRLTGKINEDIILRIFSDENQLMAFINFFDGLSVEMFENFISLIERIGAGLASAVNNLPDIDENNSRLFQYLCSLEYNPSQR